MISCRYDRDSLCRLHNLHCGGALLALFLASRMQGEKLASLVSGFTESGTTICSSYELINTIRAANRYPAHLHGYMAINALR